MIGGHLQLYACLQRYGVEYIVIGGVAAIVHGVPRTTLDIDLLINATEPNATALLQAFLEAGLGTAALTDAKDVLAHEVTIFRDRLRVDVQTRTPGIDFASARPRALMLAVEGVQIPVLSASDLLASKEAANRPKDQQDLIVLRHLLGRDAAKS